MAVQLEPLARIIKRVRADRDDSDVAYFHSLLYLGEAVIKTATLALVAAVDNTEERYRLRHRLVRADSLGEWTDVLAELAHGPASSSLRGHARDSQRALTQRVGKVRVGRLTPSFALTKLSTRLAGRHCQRAWPV